MSFSLLLIPSRYFSLATESKDGNAFYAIGRAFFCGYGVKKDVVKGFSYFLTALKYSSSKGALYFTVACCYEKVFFYFSFFCFFFIYFSCSFYTFFFQNKGKGGGKKFVSSQKLL